jgi:hypothetical protein
MAQSIQAQVSPATLSKVSRLFNASLTDCLNELLQNARRAGASRVTIALSEEPRLTIADDGIGITDPQTLLTLGESDWTEETQQQESPAGMGFFSLANRNVTIRSHNWQVHLTPVHFAGGAIATVESCEPISGTQISFTVTESEVQSLDYRLRQVVKFYPLSVMWKGEAMPRQSFLDGAMYVEEWQGLRIGVGERRHWNDRETINFYGLTLHCGLPTLECDGCTLWVRVDVMDCPNLKLVLPARKELVQDGFWLSLKTEIQRVLYRYVATLPHHDLPFSQWQKARSLGVDLPMAQAMLSRFIPEVANRCDMELGALVAIGDRSVLMAVEGMTCGQQQVFWRSFQRGELDYEPLAVNSAYAGYPWYDELPRLGDVRFEIEQDGNVLSLEQWLEENGAVHQEDRRVEQIWAIARINGVNEQEMRLGCEVLLVDDPEEMWDDFEQSWIVLSQSAGLEVDELAELLEAAYFCLSEDSDSDSPYTQQEDFREMAYERSVRVLLTEQEALMARIKMAAERHLRWIVPSNQRLDVRLVAREGDEPRVTVAV